MKIWAWTMLFCLAMSLPAQAKVKVIDGDSLMVNGTEVRLEGIDAPEYHQECFDKDNQAYPCGQRAYEALLAFAGQDTVCEQTTVDRYHRSVAICSSGGKVINEQMVLSGWAVAYTHYNDAFAEAEKKARRDKRGIWQGRFMKPELYRALMRK